MQDIHQNPKTFSKDDQYSNSHDILDGETQRDGGFQTSEFTCGLLSWRSRALQRFARPGWFLLFQCWFVLAQGMIVSGLTGVVVSSLEKRFYLKTSQVGAITSCYDIAAATMAIVVSYYGHHHKPKWLGCGAIILSIGCFLFALPHLLVGDYIPSGNENDLCIANVTSSARSNTATCHSSVWYIILTFVIAECFIGVGATPVYILGPAYIDENVRHTTSGVFLGTMYAIATIGPALGYLVGGKFLAIFVDLEQPPGVDLKPTDFNFIGAWWLGYIAGGSIAMLCSVPLLMFPKELPETAKIRAEKKQLSDTIEDANTHHCLKQLLPDLKDLLTNPTFVFLALAATFEGFAVSGFSTFSPKFMESQFRMSSPNASLYTGLVTVPGGSIGMFMGGYLIKRMRWNCSQILKACCVIATIAAILVTVILFGCPNREFAGITTPYFNSSSTGTMENSCNQNCDCRINHFTPLCNSADQITYYSPCYAGCTEQNIGPGKNIFSNCSCFKTPLSQALKGSGCAPECNSLIPYMIGVFFLMVFTFLNNIPAMTATLRCIPESKGSFGLGIQQLIVRILAFIPGPILFGLVIDTTCRFSQKDSCDEGADRNCLEYDTDSFRYVMFGMGCLFKTLSAVSFIFAWKFYKLPNTGKAKEFGSTVVVNSLATEIDGSDLSNRDSVQLTPPTQIINVNSSNGSVVKSDKDSLIDETQTVTVF